MSVENYRVHGSEEVGFNDRIARRDDVFYWQTDRHINQAEAHTHWSDRHSAFTPEDVLTAAGLEKSARVAVDESANKLPGTINSSYVLEDEGHGGVVVRAHPKGVVNGYFHVESVAAQMAVDAGLPSYETLNVQDVVDGDDDFAFQLVTKLPGTNMTHWLEAHPDDVDHLTIAAGRMMARLHAINVEGFGPFDNNIAREQERLVGLHQTQNAALLAGLDFNLETLIGYNIINTDQAHAMKGQFEDASLDGVEPKLIHNDFADWNLATDGEDITGIFDWDECVGGDPLLDIACWSLFFEPERLPGFIEGYYEDQEKPDDFEARFELYRLRYVISKLTLRLRRNEWDRSDDLDRKIEIAKVHLQHSLDYFDMA